MGDQGGRGTGGHRGTGCRGADVPGNRQSRREEVRDASCPGRLALGEVTGRGTWGGGRGAGDRVTQPPGTSAQPGPTAPSLPPGHARGRGEWPLSLLPPVQPRSPPALAQAHSDCPCVCWCWSTCPPLRPPCPPQPPCPQLTDLLCEDLVERHLSPVFQVLLHNAADAGETPEGLSIPPDPCPPTAPCS